MKKIINNILETAENWTGLNLGLVAVSGRNHLRQKEWNAGWTVRLAGPGNTSPIKK
jgi:hypothetical protein